MRLFFAICDGSCIVCVCTVRLDGGRLMNRLSRRRRGGYVKREENAGFRGMVCVCV